MYSKSAYPKNIYCKNTKNFVKNFNKNELNPL